MTPIVLKRGLTMALASVFIGVMFTLVAAVVITTPLVARGFFAILGVPMLLLGLRELVTRPPRLRADADGVWFGGGGTIPWSEIASVYAPVVTVRIHGVPAKPAAIAFEFRTKRTILRTPFRYWLASAFSVGDLDISTRDLKERAEVVAAKLDAMRQASRQLSPDDSSAAP